MYGTIPGMNGTIPVMYSTIPGMNGTIPTMYGTIPAMYGTHVREESPYMAWNCPILARIFPCMVGNNHIYGWELSHYMAWNCPIHGILQRYPNPLEIFNYSLPLTIY